MGGDGGKPKRESEGSSSLEDWLVGYALEAPLSAQNGVVTLRGTRKRDGRRVIVRAVDMRGRSAAPARKVLERERDALRIEHPNLPTLLDVHDGVAEAASGRTPRLALVLADHGGSRLDAVLDRKPHIDATHAMAITIEVARALAAMHRHGEPHGALRPELVELTADGAVYLHGAGQRHQLASRGADVDLALPENMAPEQILGDPPDEQTDVFLLGMLLYRMVAGHAAFDAGESNVSHHIRHSAPTPLGRHVAGAPEGLSRILSRCLQKRARDRYPDVASLESELWRSLRKITSLPTEMLVSRALADAHLGDALPAPRERGVERGGAWRLAWLRRSAMGLGAAMALLGIGVVVVRSCGEDGGSASGDPRGIVKRPAQLRVLAHPWAEVHIDGKLVDVTPIGFAIEVPPGPHVVVFKHPNAPDETRSIEIIAGQTILLDVEMRIERPEDASAQDAGDASDEDLSP